MTDLKHEIRFTPAWDERHTDAGKNYGIHGVDIRWLVIGPAGAIQFVLCTNWHLPAVVQEHGHRPWGDWQPMAADIGYHSPKPMYEGQISMGDKCELVEGECYYDGSPLDAKPYYDILRKQGGDALWKALETEYHERFEVNDS